MSEKPEGLPTEPNADERLRRLESTLHAQMQSIADRTEERLWGAVGQMIDRYDTPDRSQVPDFRNDRGESVARLYSPTERLYRSMPEEVRRIRNPDSDHWMAEFVRGVITNNVPQHREADAKLNEMFGRADTLEGAADAAGGFAGGTGGVLLPRPLENLVAIARDRVAKMARYATTYMMTAQEHNIPTGNAVTCHMVGEATSPLTQGEPTYAQVPLIARRAAAKVILGNDFLEDAAINIVNFITMRGGAALGAKEDAQFFKEGSTGVAAPNVVRLGGTAYAEISTGEFKYADAVSMYSSLQQEYRAGARWFISPSVIALLANVRDGNGRPFYQGLLERPTYLADEPGAVGVLLGHPAHEVQLTSGDIWFGDPAATYAIGRRHGIRVDVSREFLFDTFRTIFLIHQRFAGQNVDTAAAQLCSGITSATSL